MILVNICANNTATFSAHHPVPYTSRLPLGSPTGRAKTLDQGSGNFSVKGQIIHI